MTYCVIFWELCLADLQFVGIVSFLYDLALFRSIDVHFCVTCLKMTDDDYDHHAKSTAMWFCAVCKPGLGFFRKK